MFTENETAGHGADEPVLRDAAKEGRTGGRFTGRFHTVAASRESVGADGAL